jgi:murein DD-endopeptidase MepM/ murein hydrolase activator NlpD
VRLVQPWPDPYTVNPRSGYGMRFHPIRKVMRMHHGVDVACPVGTRLTAPADGKVIHKGNHASSGFNLILEHAGGWHTVYYHLREPSPLKMGQQVKTGDLIAHSGNTGASTGPHLHWELRRSRREGDTVDPVPHLVRPTPAQLGVPPMPELPKTADHLERIANRRST